MNMKFKRWLRFWVWVDLIGLCLSIFLIVTYIIWGDNFSEHFQNLWSNLAIEVLGVWVSVRIIDFLIQRHKSFKETRFKQLDYFGHFYRIATHVHQYSPSYQHDIENLQREVYYHNKRWPRRKKHFYNDEKEFINSITNKMPEIISTCIELELIGDLPITKDKFKELKDKLRNQLNEYRNELDTLRENIWEETHPDD